LIALPLLGFVALAVLFFRGLESGDPSRLPSALIGRPAPNLSLPALEGLMRENTQVPGLDPSKFQGRVTLVNVWASWCIPCRTEHPQLERLATDPRFQLVGINYRDSAENARRFLGQYGNPFAAVGVDTGGRAAIEWGVYGMPETFVINGKGYVLLGTRATLDASVWEYNPATDNWTQKNSFEGSVRDSAVGFALGNYGFVATGRSSTLRFDDLWMFDPTAVDVD